MFGLFDDVYDDYFYQPKRQIPAQRRRQQSEEDLYEQLFGQLNRNQRQPRKEEQPVQKNDSAPKVQKVRVTAKNPVQGEEMKQTQKPRQIATPPRKVAELSDDSKITNRETIDPPEIAFKTYKPSNVILTVPQLVKPLSVQATAHLRTEPKRAVVVLDEQEAAKHVEIQASAKGKLCVVCGDSALEYSLPAFYDRSEIKATRIDGRIEVSIPLCGDESDDVMLVQIE